MKRRVRCEEGANLVEMAFVSIFLLLLVAGVADLGRAFNNYIIITNAAREGARFASRMPCNAASAAGLKSAIEAAVIREAVDSGIDLADGTLTTIAISPDPVDDGCPANGTPVDVTVSYDFATILGGVLGRAEIPLSSGTTMLFFGNDQE